MKGIEHQRTLARARHAGHHGQPVRKKGVNLPQVVFTRAMYLYGHHGSIHQNGGGVQIGEEGYPNILLSLIPINFLKKFSNLIPADHVTQYIEIISIMSDSTGNYGGMYF